MAWAMQKTLLISLKTTMEMEKSGWDGAGGVDGMGQ